MREINAGTSSIRRPDVYRSERPVITLNVLYLVSGHFAGTVHWPAVMYTLAPGWQRGHVSLDVLRPAIGRLAAFMPRWRKASWPHSGGAWRILQLSALPLVECSNVACPDGGL